MNIQKHLKLTIEKLKGTRYKGSNWVDSYNRNIRKDHIAGTINSGIDYQNNIYILVVEKEKK